MRAELWRRASQLFDAALDIEAQQRAAWLAARCENDEELRAAVLRLLAADASSREFLEHPIQPAMVVDGDVDPVDIAGASFGPYRTVERLGVGGMGEVWLAQRSDQAFEQRVAIKRLLYPTPDLVRRFQHERRVLARLHHPNIAQLFDGGLGDDGAPYFIMEYVDGQPLNAWCDSRRLGVDARIDLFLQVCDAVQYAHRNLVVHRDLKPSNILVTPEGQAKLLDFGIAKLIETTADGGATATLVQRLTPDYAAPEQVRGGAVTTATDVYALGVVLCELLAGERPYRLAGGLDLARAIVEAEPAAPSAVAARGSPEQRQRAASLRGDLDRITLRALAKEPERRYASAELLAADLRRFRSGHPVLARGEDAGYRARKFVGRNRAAVGAAVAIAIALVAATSISLRQARIATEQAARAEEKSRTAAAVKDYLLSVFSSANPYNTDGKVATARDLLEGGLDQVDRKLSGQPQVQAEIYAGFVETFLQLGNNTLGKRAGEMALAKYRQFLPSDAVEVIRVESSLAQADFNQTHFDGLIGRFENLLARTRDRGGEFAAVRADVLTLLGMTHYRMGHYEQSVRYGEAAVAQLRQAKGEPFDYEIGIVLYNLFLARKSEGRYDDAATLIDEFVPQDRKLVGPRHPGLFTDVTAIAHLMHETGRLHEAHDLYTAAANARRKQFPPNHVMVVNSRAYVADVDCELGDLDGAEAAFDELIAVAAAKGAEIAVTEFARLRFLARGMPVAPGPQR